MNSQKIKDTISEKQPGTNDLVCFIKQSIVFILLFYFVTLHKEATAPGHPQRIKMITNVITTTEHLKRICHIPDSVQWDTSTKRIYREQILQELDTINSHIQKRRNHERAKQYGKN